ncbi:MAG: hypothetical protein HC811_01530 [Flammeovirgaceae bacterium]|nr:hypothetical protein [Flammeovirgaceae bacterium]
MRVIKELILDNCKVSIYHWNNRYLIKLEMDWMEQTYKINQYDLTDESELDKILNPKFMNDAMTRFQGMSLSLQESLKSL